MQDPTQQDSASSQEPQSGSYGSAIDPYVGTPEIDVLYWVGQQNYPDTCVVRSEEFILEMFTGRNVDEDRLVQQSANHGWYVPGVGTQLEDVGNLLELHGIPTNSYDDATTYDLANELAQGHKVIIGVDSGELWGEERAVMQGGERPSDMGADHAVVVSGIDTSNPPDIRVIISDPGTGEPAASYPLDHFIAAWQDANFSVTSTEDPAPSSLPEMANFDYEAGHIPEVMGMPYEEFTSLDPESEDWNSRVEQANQQRFDDGRDYDDDHDYDDRDRSHSDVLDEAGTDHEYVDSEPDRDQEW
jgi:hypothetical protein